jgi:hypothetical protein
MTARENDFSIGSVRQRIIAQALPLTLAQVVQLAAKQIPIERIGVVIVDEPALFHGEMRVVVVVRILRNHRHILALECLHYLSDHGGLSASRATCYSYNIH